MVIFFDITKSPFRESLRLTRGSLPSNRESETAFGPRMAFSPLFGAAKLRRKIESEIKNFGFKKAAIQAVLRHVLTLFQSFDTMVQNSERVLTLYASLAVKTNN